MVITIVETDWPNTPLFLAPEDDSKLTPEILDILNRDTETLILDIILLFKNGSEGKPIVPEALLEANPYNREIMELLKKVSGA